MEFLVRISVSLPPDLAGPEREALLERERVRGVELRDGGVIRSIWRIPGRLANVGIWAAPDATALHEALVSLPVFPYTQIDVTPLARHHLTAS
jgi:muconolactone D-isomerase